MDDVNQPNYDYLADIQDILLKMDGNLYGTFFSKPFS